MTKESTALDKQKRITNEIDRLKVLFEDISPKKKNLVHATIEDVAFMTVTMQDLRESINRDGTMIEYKNGENQYGWKQSPDAQLYLQMSQKQSTAMKILLDCLPKDKPVSNAGTDGFESFMDDRE